MPLKHILLEHPSQLLEDEARGFFHIQDLFKDRIRFCSASPFFWRWLSLALTEKSGVLMGISKIAPDALFRLLSESVVGGSEKRVPFQDELQMLVMDVLEEIWDRREDSKIQEKFPEILGYFEEGESAERRDAKRYALGRDLAAGFYRYAFDAPESAKKWLDAPKDLAHPDSLWQAELWRMTFARGEKDFISPANAMSLLGEKTVFRTDPGRIVVWGHAFLAPALQAMLLHYSRSPGAGVVQFALAPVAGPGSEWFRAEEAGMIRARALGFPEPVLIPRKKSVAFPKNSVHGELRKVFLHGQVADEIKITDRSQMDFSVHAGHDKRRQAEILQNLVIALLERHKDWSPREIGILAPRSSDWFAYLKGVFKRDLGFAAGQIPVAFAGLDVADESAVHSAWNGFLNLPDRRFSRSAVLEILENPCVRSALRLDEADAEHWANLLEKSGAAWGIDAAHRAELGAGEDAFNTFAEARRRILGGMMYAGQGPGRIAEEDSSRLELDGALLAFLDKLIEIENVLRKEKKDPVEWARWSRDVILPLIAARPEEKRQDEQDLARLRTTLARQVETHEAASRLEPISGSEFRLWMERFAGMKSVMSGQPLVDGLTVGDIEDLAGIPFRALILIGLDEDTWPRRTPSPAFDLGKILAGDFFVSQGERDKAMLLESLRACEGELHVIHTGFDPDHNRERRPALPILQLLESFPKETQKQVVIKHRLQPHDARYYEPGAAARHGLVNYSLRDRSLQGVSGAEKSLGLAPPAFTQTQTHFHPSVSDLCGLLDKPLRLYYRESLGLRLEEYDEADPDLETWTLPFLKQHGDLLEIARTPPDQIETLFKNYRLNGELHDGLPGFSQRRHFTRWSENFHQAWPEKSLRPTTLFLADGPEFRAENEGLVFPGPLLPSPSGDILITGKVDGVWMNEENKIAAFTRSKRVFSKSETPSASELRGHAHEFYLPYLDALCAAAAGAFTSGSLVLVTPDRLYRIALALDKQKSLQDLGIWVNAFFEHLRNPLPLFDELLHETASMDFGESEIQFRSFFEDLVGGTYAQKRVDANNLHWLSDQTRLEDWLAEDVRRRVFELSKLFEPVREAVESLAASMPKPEKKPRAKKKSAKTEAT